MKKIFALAIFLLGAQSLSARDRQSFDKGWLFTLADSAGMSKSDSVFMRVIKESLWQELADITDKTQLEWREVFQDLNHHGVYHSGEVVGLGNLVCEKCHFHLPIYTPEVLTLCPKCGHDQFQRRPFEP